MKSLGAMFGLAVALGLAATPLGAEEDFAIAGTYTERRTPDSSCTCAPASGGIRCCAARIRSAASTAARGRSS